MVSMEIRRPYLRKYRRYLHRKLASPNLSSDQRKVLERELNGLGQPKVYDADDPPSVGSIRGGAPVVKLDVGSDLTRESLSKQPHSKLYLYALQQDLEVHPGDTKAQVIETILRHIQGDKP
jgi:hypothetical protein